MRTAGQASIPHEGSASTATNLRLNHFASHGAKEFGPQRAINPLSSGIEVINTMLLPSLISLLFLQLFLGSIIPYVVVVLGLRDQPLAVGQ